MFRDIVVTNEQLATRCPPLYLIPHPNIIHPSQQVGTEAGFTDLAGRREQTEKTAMDMVGYLLPRHVIHRVDSKPSFVGIL